METAAHIRLGKLGPTRIMERSFNEADVYVYDSLAVTALFTPNAFGLLLTLFPL
jgi:hypothetical protein